MRRTKPVLTGPERERRERRQAAWCAAFLPAWAVVAVLVKWRLFEPHPLAELPPGRREWWLFACLAPFPMIFGATAPPRDEAGTRATALRRGLVVGGSVFFLSVGIAPLLAALALAGAVLPVGCCSAGCAALAGGDTLPFGGVLIAAFLMHSAPPVAATAAALFLWGRATRPSPVPAAVEGGGIGAACIEAASAAPTFTVGAYAFPSLGPGFETEPRRLWAAGAAFLAAAFARRWWLRHGPPAPTEARPA